MNWVIIDRSFATGSVVADFSAGGLVGVSFAYVADSYATGPVSAGQGGGGFAAGTVGHVSSSYSLGSVLAPCAGGFVGGDGSGDQLTTSYWDMDTSGITDPHRGACSPPDAPGIIGLTDTQMKAGLPVGFDPNIWGQSANINNGYPYLLANPPQ